ncbi:hypothetical protein [Roseospira navarrensis]|uniref:Transglycosylase SLT domain-containing protein n=1 Tax=Roseospira navarrensis TaxID=140058 RepID=A0A7X1ZDF7_9PROT|nr:hypothetical protein [Roseospira navarrensis]MQX36523.1 hypothetical protein [Roseospira navarrensis]
MTGLTTPSLPQQLAASVQIGNRTVGGDVLTGIRDASVKTGVDFAYMLAKANQESGFRPDARNLRGTASGLFQFTRDTWLDTLQRHGAKHGLGDIAARIHTDSRGRLGIADSELEQNVLALRRDPGLSSIMAAEYAAENKRHLEASLGRPAGTTDIYLAHFLGPGGAVTFLTAVGRTPDRPAADVLPEAAHANPGLFLDHGRPRSLRELHGLLDATISDAMRRFQGVESLTRPPAPPPAAKPTPPAPEDMGATRSAQAGPPVAPGAKPVPPGFEDMGAVRTAEVGPPVAPGAKPAAPPPEDMGATRVADAGPPVPPGPRPLPPGVEAPAPLPVEPPPTPVAPPPEIRMAEADPAPAAPGMPVAPIAPAGTESASTIARVLSATRAVEDASAARGFSLPGASAVAVAALLDSMSGPSAPASPASPAAAPAPVAAPVAEPAPAPLPLPGMDADADVPFLALARTARGLFEPDAAPWPAPTAGTDAANTRVLAVGGAVSTRDGAAGLTMEVPGLAAVEPAAGAAQTARAEPDPAPAPTPAPEPPRDTALRAAPADYLTGAEATRAIAAILGRHRSG